MGPTTRDGAQLRKLESLDTLVPARALASRVPCRLSPSSRGTQRACPAGERRLLSTRDTTVLKPSGRWSIPFSLGGPNFPHKRAAGPVCLLRNEGRGESEGGKRLLVSAKSCRGYFLSGT